MNERLKVSTIEIVQLSPDQWKILRDMKLASLKEEQIALENPQEATEKYLKRTEEEWRKILSGEMSGGRLGQTIMFFARENSEYIGMVSSIISESSDTAIVQHMYVKGEHRGKGIGKKLIARLMEELKQKVSKVELEVVETQVPAIKLYESMGFTRTGVNEAVIDWVNPPLNEVLMELIFPTDQQ